MYLEHIKNEKTVKNPIEKCVKDINRHSQKGKTQIVHTHFKRYSVSLVLGEINI